MAYLSVGDSCACFTSASDSTRRAGRPDRGWGYHAGKATHPEPTCLALLAFSVAREQFSHSRLRTVRPHLNAITNPTAVYRLADGRPEAGWPTAIALTPNQCAGASPEEMKSTVERVLSVESRTIEKGPETADMENDIDLMLVGWPWAAANFG